MVDLRSNGEWELVAIQGRLRSQVAELPILNYGGRKIGMRAARKVLWMCFHSYTNVMKNLLSAFLSFSLFVLVGAVSVSAQTRTTSPIATPSVSFWNSACYPSGPTAGPAKWKKGEFSPLSMDSEINYYNASTPVHDWSTPFTFNNSSEMFYGPAERFTLGTDQGYLDSVHITFDALQGDSIYVLIDPDTLYTANATQTFHLINIYDPNATLLYKNAVYIGNVNSKTPGMLTLKYPSIPVPKNFHVVVEPRLVVNGTSLNYTSSFLLRGDSEATRARTVDNTHSTFVDLHLTQNLPVSTWVVDSFFVFTGDAAPLYSNFDIQAFAAPGAGPSGSLAFTVPNTNFGDVPANSTKLTYVYLKNSGSSLATVTSLAVDGGPYTFATPGHSLPYGIQPGDSLRISVTFAPIAPGSYPANLTATLDDGSTVSLQLSGTSSNSGVGESAVATSNLIVYPNPSSSEITVTSDESTPARVDILDLLGRTVASMQFTGKTTFDVSRLEPGRYEAIMHTPNGVERTALLIQH